MHRSPTRSRPLRRGVITIAAIGCGAFAACGGSTYTERAITGPSQTTTDASVLGVTVTRADVEAAAPAVPVPASTATTAALPPATPPRPATTRAPRPVTTTPPPATTTTAAPRPNRFAGTYTARPGTDRVTVELFSNGAVFDSRELGADSAFEFAGLPDGAYRIVITDTIDDDDPADGADTSSQVISASDSVGLTGGDTAYASCGPDTDCTTTVQDGG